MDGLATCCPEPLLSALRIEERADLGRVRSLLRSRPRTVSAELWDALTEEAEEVAADNRSFGSERGAYVGTIQDWVQGSHAELRPEAEEEKVVGGGHARTYVVVVSGVAPDAECAGRLRSLLAAQRPPDPASWDVHVG